MAIVGTSVTGFIALFFANGQSCGAIAIPESQSRQNFSLKASTCHENTVNKVTQRVKKSMQDRRLFKHINYIVT